MKATRKLIPALAMLLVAAVVMTSASYAWFTMSKTVSADGMNLTVTAPTNLLISSLDGTTASSFDTTTTIGTGSSAANQGNLDAVLYPSSSLTGATGSFFAISKTDEDGAPTANTTYFEATNDDNYTYYVDYHLWVKTTGDKSVDVSIDSTNSSITLKNENDATAADASCVRMAVLSSTGTAYTKNIIGTAFGEADVNEEDTPKTVNGPYTGVAKEGSETYQGVDDTNLADGSNTIFTVAANEVATEIIVRVWFEGQFESCKSSIATETVTCKLVLNGTDHTA